MAAERSAAAALESLLNAIDANDPQTGSHVRRVAAYALILADAADLGEHQRRAVERVALFHDIGKIDEALFDIIHDESALTHQERRAIATHPARGAQVLAPLLPFYPDLALGVLAHHERWDGQGYPRQLRGRQIPLTARIVTLADTFDAITHARRYRHGRNTEAAAKIIAAGRGTQFDPDLVDLMLFPPVYERFVREQRRRQGPTRPRVIGNDRRTGETETQVPDVTFRWRPESRESLPLDPQRQEVPR
jgi:HD-GYP domain-containing protein (c-di-GMP phosphodiesterase class II)